jgi:UDP-galactopyranose mutase
VSSITSQTTELFQQRTVRRNVAVDSPGHLSDIVCFSHLRWNFVWQRPQHLMSRLARKRRVFFVEEPVEALPGAQPTLIENVTSSVTVLTPSLPANAGFAPGFSDDSNAVIQQLLTQYLRSRGVRRNTCVWYYTPLAVGAEPDYLATSSSTVVYDVMDELARFKGASPLIPARDALLVKRADIVFSGGPRLHERFEHGHPNAQCFPSGVEPRHFAAASDVPDDLRHLAGPLIGFYGVLDERIDFDLIDEMARQRPDWSIVLIGPIVKVNPTELPSRDNIHYLGARTYELLPAYLGAFDVAIMPFALNESTEFISPTKTLEYLAGGKPVVSTPITDVIRLYGPYVSIATDTSEFIATVENALQSPRQPGTDAGLAALIRKNDWETIAAEMSRHLDAASRPDSRSLQPSTVSFARSLAAHPTESELVAAE